MENVKEKIPTMIIAIVALLICGLMCYFSEYYQSVYYTQVDSTKVEKISASDDMKFEYTLVAYNENGKKKEIKFKTSRELREEAFLMLEVRIMGVHAWKEVQYEELPEKVKDNYAK